MSILGKNAADTAAGDYVKARAGFSCEVCGRYFGPKHPELDAAHFYSRGGPTRGARYNPANILSACRTCHRDVLPNNRALHAALLIQRVGKEEFAEMVQQAHAPAPRDEKVAHLARYWRRRTGAEFGFYRGRGPALSTFSPGPVA